MLLAEVKVKVKVKVMSLAEVKVKVKVKVKVMSLAGATVAALQERILHGAEERWEVRHLPPGL